MFVDDSSLNNYDSFMVGHPHCAFRLIVMSKIVDASNVLLTISYITINLKAQRGCTTIKLS